MWELETDTLHPSIRVLSEFHDTLVDPNARGQESQDGDLAERRLPEARGEWMPLENGNSVNFSSAGKTGAIVVHSCESAST